MNTDKKTKIPQDMPVLASLNRNRGWLLALGILFVILGVVGLGMTVALTMASMVIIGIFAVIAGCFQLIDAARSRHWKAGAWHALIGILYLFAGAIIIRDPVLASTVFTAMIAWVLIVIGITRIIMSMMLRDVAGWVWLFLAGVMAIVLGGLILAHWPMSGFWVIGLFIAIELMVNGWSYIMLAMALKR